ncbi:unnamed protein product [Moneuplotes crassus]|uniref:Endonuclease/exonuclease/phosphatase domain-containing protein n=1 Tax=Euplotes crassus TaxID=5936 RepID=A0AAD1UMQ2_EUPCR|nr:unnamed protein product [Moneuplotes crassus]
MFLRTFATKARAKKPRLSVLEKTEEFIKNFKKTGKKFTQITEKVDNSEGKYKQLVDEQGNYIPDKLSIAAWNVNGIRAVLRKESLQHYLEEYSPDILCLSETKIDEKRLKKLAIHQYLPSEYMSFWDCCKPPHAGYSGTGFLTKYAPLNVSYGLGILEHDAEGRVITCEFEHFYVLSVYTPNGMDSLNRIEYRVFEWDEAFRLYVKKLQETGKLVIVTGDLNVCHEPIDIHNPRQCEQSAGFTFWERSSFTKILKTLELVDTFREFYPETANYTWWSNRGGRMRLRNLGRRIDYVLVDQKVIDGYCVDDSAILNEIMGSDHCPVSMTLDMKKLQMIV